MTHTKFYFITLYYIFFNMLFIKGMEKERVVSEPYCLKGKGECPMQRRSKEKNLHFIFALHLLKKHCEDEWNKWMEDCIKAALNYQIDCKDLFDSIDSIELKEKRDKFDVKCCTNNARLNPLAASVLTKFPSVLPDINQLVNTDVTIKTVAKLSYDPMKEACLLKYFKIKFKNNDTGKKGIHMWTANQYPIIQRDFFTKEKTKNESQ